MIAIEASQWTFSSHGHRAIADGSDPVSAIKNPETGAGVSAFYSGGALHLSMSTNTVRGAVQHIQQLIVELTPVERRTLARRLSDGDYCDVTVGSITLQFRCDALLLHGHGMMLSINDSQAVSCWKADALQLARDVRRW